MSAPSKFKPEYCQRIISFMANGYSLTAFAGDIGIARETVYAWEHTHPEFREAVQKARATRVLYWEQRLLKCDRAEATPIIFALKNACADEWRQQPEVSIAVNNGRDVSTFETHNATQADLLAELHRRGINVPVTSSPKML